MKRKSDLEIVIINFYCQEFTVKVDKAKLFCMIKMNGKLLKSFRREINKKTKQIKALDKISPEETEGNNETICSSESSDKS